MVRVKKQLLQSFANTVRIKRWKGKKEVFKSNLSSGVWIDLWTESYIIYKKWPFSKILISELLNDIIIHYESQRPGPYLRLAPITTNEIRVEPTAKCAKFMTADTNMVVADMPQTLNLIRQTQCFNGCILTVIMCSLSLYKVSQNTIFK